MAPYTSSILPLITLNISIAILASHYPTLLYTPAFSIFHLWFLFSSIVAFQLSLPVCYSSSTYFRFFG
ncbi:hypothetical protein K440DRAFT_632187 [Wilcoxina mikolae CBS 423.85]|nr:hypothetical protein K440DRAFT_632187 [Wilcoxina mikolae CBS 423.85]